MKDVPPEIDERLKATRKGIELEIAADKNRITGVLRAQGVSLTEQLAVGETFRANIDREGQTRLAQIDEVTQAIDQATHAFDNDSK